MPVPHISALPIFPSRADAANFSARADDALTALPPCTVEINEVVDFINDTAGAVADLAAAAVNAPGTSASSTTSLTVGTGGQALAVQTGKNFVPGMWVTIARTAAPNNWMVGYITAYNGVSGDLSVSVQSINGAGTFTDWTIALCPPISFPVATAAMIRAGTDTAHAVTPASLYDAADFVVLADAATIAVDMATGLNFTVTLGGNRTLGNPSNMKIGQAGVIEIKQGATAHTLAYGSWWKFPGGTPSVTSSSNALDLISYVVRSASYIECALLKGFS